MQARKHYPIASDRRFFVGFQRVLSADLYLASWNRHVVMICVEQMP